jgi:hypothetical protein
MENMPTNPAIHTTGSAMTAAVTSLAVFARD